MKHNIRINLTENSKLPSVDVNNVPFGKVYSDHMFVADYIDGAWQDPRIVPFGDITMSPANLTLHYGQSIFEGMKCSKDENGNPLLFRLSTHVGRLNKSARRMAMPELPEELFVDAISKLVAIDHQWIPDSPSALYLRPFMFATDEFIGVRPSSSYRFMIFTGPVSSYYKDPVKLVTAQNFIRAARGGVGGAKTAGNYAATLYPMQLAAEEGFDQIMWLCQDFKYIQECGTMNLFFVIGDTVITPTTVEETILEGITRDCFIQILKDNFIKVEERKLSIEEVVEAHKNGELKDCFGSGTAAVVAPVSEIMHNGFKMVLPALGTRKISQLLKKELTDIRSAVSEDKHNWISKIEVANTVKC